MTVDTTSGCWVVRNPLTGKRKKFTAEDAALRAVKTLNEWLETERALAALQHGRPQIEGLVVKWMEDKVPLMPWAPSTRSNYLAKARRIRKDLGKRTIAHTDCMFIEDWISARTRKADAFNDWRYVFCMLWSFAVSRKLADVNEAEKIEERSTSKKIESNQKDRQPLDIRGFRDIHEKAEPWLQLAMELSLVTLQGRSEVCNMQHSHFRGGHLFVIRDKTSGDSDMAFIKIALTEQLLALQSRSRQLDGTVSPYLIHRRPDSMRREHIDPKPHWTYVMPDYLSKAFASARDQVERFAALAPRERPTFHEIRGLGSRLYLEQGLAKTAIQALMTHTHERVTEIYLQGGDAALSDDDFQRVVAPLRLSDVL
jgi:hypothetical protein